MSLLRSCCFCCTACILAVLLLLLYVMMSRCLLLYAGVNKCLGLIFVAMRSPNTGHKQVLHMTPLCL